MDSYNIIPIIGRYAMTFLSALFAIIEPALPYLLICSGFIFLDCYSAFRLAQRVKQSHPKKASGKFRSEKLRHIFRTIIEVYTVVLLVHFAQVHIASGLPLDITKVVAGAVCGWQFWSYLENTSSCNGATWARIAKNIFVDKTERHFDINLSDMQHNENLTENP